MVLIHWPGVKGLKLNDERNSELRRITYKKLEELHSRGVLKLIGVSNYTVKHLKDLLSYANIKPHLVQVNKLEFNFFKMLKNSFSKIYSNLVRISSILATKRAG